MVDASPPGTNQTSLPEPQAADVAAAKNNASPGATDWQGKLSGAHLAAAATIDELLAKEALANLKRTRATVHAETVKSEARIPGPAGHTHRKTTAVGIHG